MLAVWRLCGLPLNRPSQDVRAWQVLHGAPGAGVRGAAQDVPVLSHSLPVRLRRGPSPDEVRPLLCHLNKQKSPINPFHQGVSYLQQSWSLPKKGFPDMTPAPGEMQTQILSDELADQFSRRSRLLVLQKQGHVGCLSPSSLLEAVRTVCGFSFCMF